MMLGEINFDDLYYPYKMVIEPNKTKSNISLEIPQFSENIYRIPKVGSDEDLSTFSIPNFENGWSGEFSNVSSLFNLLNYTMLNMPTSNSSCFSIPNLEYGFSGEFFNLSSEFKFENFTKFKLPRYEEFIDIAVPQFHGFITTEIPNLVGADVATSPKPPFYPATSIVLILIFILLVPVVALNLLVGLAVNDVQVRQF